MVRNLVNRNKRNQGIIGLIKTKPDLIVNELDEILNINEETIRRNLTELRNARIIDRVGGDFESFWVNLK